MQTFSLVGDRLMLSRFISLPYQGSPIRVLLHMAVQTTLCMKKKTKEMKELAYSCAKVEGVEGLLVAIQFGEGWYELQDEDLLKAPRGGAAIGHDVHSWS